MTVASLRGRRLRVLSELAGLVGAEITGTVGFAAAAGLLAVAAPRAWVPFVALPVVLAVAGPVGYDMARSWVPEDERMPSAAAGFRAAALTAGVAAALMVGLAVFGVAAGVPSSPTAVMAMIVFLGLPYLAAVGRNLAVRTLSGAKAVLPVALVVTVVAAPALFFCGALLLGRESTEN